METITLTTNQAAAAGAVLGGALGTIVALSIIFYVLVVVASWKMFTKAGEPGWKAIIPIYNAYIMFKIAGIKNWFWGLVTIAVIQTFVSSAFGASAQTFVSIATIILAIAEIVVYIMLDYKIAKAFGKGIGYTLGLIFLPNIFTLILGFGKAEYVGTENN